MCGANQKHSAKALRHVQLEDELDEIATFVERKGSSKHRKGRKVWAMVDSGSFVTIANCSKAFPGHVVKPSAGSIAGVKYSNASGGDIMNRGQVIVTHILDDGSELDVPFQDGDVQVPIISVKDFVHKGSIVKFKKQGGTIRLPTGKIMRFVEKLGVYFICLNVLGDALADDDGNPIPVIASIDHPKLDKNEHEPSVVATLDRSIQALAVEDLAHIGSSLDSVPPPPDDTCRDACCRRGMIRRPGRKSSFTRPAP